MKLSLKKIAGVVAVFALVIGAALVPVTGVSAQDCDVTQGIQGGINCANPAGPGEEETGLFGQNSIFTTIVNTLLFVIGAISVIMLIYGGIRYTTSAGNSAHITTAKNTIMYAIIGLVIAFLAFAVVNWILGALQPNA